MSARHIALMLLLAALASCKSFKGEVVNNADEDVYLRIYDNRGKLGTYGEIKSQQNLTLNSDVDDIARMDYRYGNVQCSLRADQLKRIVQWDDGFWKIILKHC